MTKTLPIFCLILAVTVVSPAKSDEKDLVIQPERQLAVEKIAESLVFIEKSNKEELSGSTLKSQQYIKIAEIKLQASQSLLRSYTIKADRAKLENDLTSLRSRNKELKEEFKDNVSELRQYKDKATLSN